MPSRPLSMRPQPLMSQPLDHDVVRAFSEHDAVPTRCAERQTAEDHVEALTSTHWSVLSAASSVAVAAPARGV